MEIRPAREDEFERAAMLFLIGRQQIPPALREKFEGLLEKLKSMGVALSRQVVAVSNGRMVGSCACPHLDDTSAHILTPGVDLTYPGSAPELKSALVCAAAEQARKAGARIAQAILEHDDGESSKLFHDAGFLTRPRISVGQTTRRIMKSFSSRQSSALTSRRLIARSLRRFARFGKSSRATSARGRLTPRCGSLFLWKASARVCCF